MAHWKSNRHCLGNEGLPDCCMAVGVSSLTEWPLFTSQKSKGHKKGYSSTKVELFWKLVRKSVPILLHVQVWHGSSLPSPTKLTSHLSRPTYCPGPCNPPGLTHLHQLKTEHCHLALGAEGRLPCPMAEAPPLVAVVPQPTLEAVLRPHSAEVVARLWGVGRSDVSHGGGEHQGAL